jgi:hypothetical protein
MGRSLPSWLLGKEKAPSGRQGFNDNYFSLPRLCCFMDRVLISTLQPGKNQYYKSFSIAAKSNLEALSPSDISIPGTKIDPRH